MLPFTADVLFSSFERFNQGLWPLPLLACLLALAAILATLRPIRFGDRATAALLALAWLWTGYGYHYLVRAQIDFAALGYAALFIIEGLRIAWTGALRARLAFRFDGDLPGWAGLALALSALVALPLADGLAYGWTGSRVVGLAPGPTALLTLGLLLLNRTRASLPLAVVPLLWTLAAGATGWILAIPQDIALAPAGVAGFALILWHTRRR